MWVFKHCSQEIILSQIRHLVIDRNGKLHYKMVHILHWPWRFNFDSVRKSLPQTLQLVCSFLWVNISNSDLNSFLHILHVRWIFMWVFKRCSLERILSQIGQLLSCNIFEQALPELTDRHGEKRSNAEDQGCRAVAHLGHHDQCETVHDAKDGLPHRQRTGHAIWKNSDMD